MRAKWRALKSGCRSVLKKCLTGATVLEMAFHEKAGRSQAESLSILIHKQGFFSAELSPVATLPSALFGERLSLGASWVFSFQ